MDPNVDPQLIRLLDILDRNRFFQLSLWYADDLAEMETIANAELQRRYDERQ
jgi:hypothetical protein